METEPAANPAALVPGVHRAIRLLDTGEGPFRGTLVVNGTDGVAVMVAADLLAGWRGWTYAGCEHVAGPLDLVRRVDGHDVLLPWCTEQVEAFLGRRVLADALLTAGEVSTLVVSLLRGMDELYERSPDQSSGQWWLTDAGRPLFVIGEGDDVKAASARIIERLRRDCGDRALGRVLAAVHGVLTEGRARPRPSGDQLASWETELFEQAAPRPLLMQQHAPVRTRGIEVLHHARRTAPVAPTRRGSRARTSETGERGRTRSESALRRAGGMLRDARVAVSELIVERTRGGLPRDTRVGDARPRDVRPRDDEDAATGRRGHRRRPMLVAGGAAAAVLVGGLLWPGGATGESAETERPDVIEVTESSATGDDGGGASSTPVPEASTVESADAGDDVVADDPVIEGGRLLRAISECAESGDLSCPLAVAEGTSGIVEALSTALVTGEEPKLALVDSYGDVAVVRLSVRTGEAPPGDETPIAEESGAGESGQKMLVLIRIEQKWLIRDVYDVADQPG